MEHKAITLQDFPEHRRIRLMSRFLPGTPVEEIEAELNAARGRVGDRCSVTWPARGVDSVALEGDDGRWHLRVGDRMLCTGHRDWPRKRTSAPVPLGSEILHQQEVHAYTDGETYRIDLRSVADREAWQYREATALWKVELTGKKSPPDLVRPRLRCPVNAYYGDWGSYVDPTQWKGRIRAYLTPLIGPGCHGCHRSPGVFIDHDHGTGRVRGLLCVYCNTHIDQCPHPAGCEWADYLNAPPAWQYNRKYLDRSHEKRKAARSRPVDGRPPRGPAAPISPGDHTDRTRPR
ncbi:endonuclease domain-containing protein [Streptomyces mutabilis]|uniref:endonuclease domain-containing protein n=1 Tax=Streptomyces mutabilis TaxID=67332 RepID=UPI00099BFAA9|nr:endonuclease domain-containing protein [Streptomyces mutabilis]